MVGDGRTLKHLAFFEELASLDESDSNWRGVSAGLVVLRLIDAWVEDGADAVLGDAWGVRAVRAAIEEIPAGTPTRVILGGVVDALERSAPNDMHAVAPRLIAYARALEFESRWSLAADVYRAVIAHAHPIEDSDFAIDAHIQLGVCLRQVGDLDSAEAAYRTAGQIAGATGDLVGVVRARVGEGKVALARGNLPRAERLLDDAIVDATGPTMRGVRVMARHDRAHVAALRGDYEFTIKLAYQALEEAELPIERDRLLSDIGAAFNDLGVYSAACDAFLVLTVTAQEPYVRWTATLNLLEIAQKSGTEPLFERYRRELADVTLPPRLAADYHLYVGQGLVKFGQPAEGIAAFERALEIATEHGFNQTAFQIESVLAEARRAERSRQAAESTWVAPSEELDGIVRALREMRQEVGAGS